MRLFTFFMPFLSSIIPNNQLYFKIPSSNENSNLDQEINDSLDTQEHNLLLRKYSDSKRFLLFAKHYSHRSHSSHRSHTSHSSGSSHYSSYTNSSTKDSNSSINNDYSFKLSAENITATTVDLAYDGFHQGSIYISKNNSTHCECLEDTPFWTFRNRSNTKTISDLVPGTTYIFQLNKSENLSEYALLSNEIKIRTKELALQVSDITSTSMKVSWGEKSQAFCTIFVNGEKYKETSLEVGSIIIDNLTPEKNYSVVLKYNNVAISNIINAKTIADPYYYNRQDIRFNSDVFTKSLNDLALSIEKEIILNFKEKQTIYVLDLWSESEYNILGRESSLLLNEFFEKSKYLKSWLKKIDINFCEKLRNQSIVTYKDSLQFLPSSEINLICYGNITEYPGYYYVKISVLDVSEENIIYVKEISIPK